MARRSAAARSVCGGRTTSDAATATALATSRATARTKPPGTYSASRRPGSGLVAGERTSPLPRGNSTTCSTKARGPARATGTTAAADVRRAVAVARTAERRPAVTAIRARPTGRRGQAVHFRAAAAPITSPAATPAPGPEPTRAASASPRHISPITGRSTPPTARGRATAGNVSSSAVARAEPAAGAPPGLRDLAVAYTQAAKAAQNHSRASASGASGVSPRSAWGRPKRAMPGRYGL